MSSLRLLISSLFFYWRTHLAVLLGVAAGAAVISGALIVGDSVRSSLRDLTLARLGAVDFATTGGGFMTAELAERLEQAISAESRGATVAPGLVMRAGLTHTVDGAIQRSGNVNVYGLDNRLWQMLPHGGHALPEPGEIVLNQRVAEALGVNPGDQVAVNLEVPSAIPRESLLGERDDLTREMLATVSSVLEDEIGAGRFGLNPSQQIPLVAFVPLEDLQQTLGLAATRPSRRNPIARPARINALFLASGGKSAAGQQTGPSLSEWSEKLRDELTLPDLGLRLVEVPEEGYLSLESERMILDDATVAAARRAAEASKAKTSEVDVYLANELISEKASKDYAMYSIVAGVDFSALDAAPFGPWEYLEGEPARSADEVVLNEFVAREQLRVAVGDPITMKYYRVGSHGELPEESRSFRVAGVVALAGPAADRNLTPSLQGITDADNFSDWEQPFEMDLERITPADDEYWDAHRATPKAFITMEAANELFASRYGSRTSVRVAIPGGQSAADFAKVYEKALLAEIDPRAVGLAVEPVKAQGLQAASGTTDFTGLFIGFSFFIILSALILIGLLFRLGIEQRSRELGLLTAVGFTQQQRRWLALAESLVVVLAGGVLGTLLGIAYAQGMLHGLTTWWRGAIGTRFLVLDVRPWSLMIGFVATVLMAFLTVLWSLRAMKKRTPRGLLAGQIEEEASDATKRAGMGPGLTFGSLGLALVLIVAGLLGAIPSQEAFGGFSWQVVSFFVAGILLLTGAIAALSHWLRRGRSATVHTASGLGFRNAARQRLRSLSTVALIACATFVLVAVAASRRDPSVELPLRDSGNGGFLLLAESTTPLPFAIDTPEGRSKLGMSVGPGAQQETGDAEILTKMKTVSFRVRPGDDASCLNLYQTNLPTVLGVPETMIERGGFRFTATPGEAPWTLLQEELPPTVVGERSVPTIPVLGDANTLMYSLKKGVGDTMLIPDAANAEYALRIVGMLDGSVFQGMLLMAEAPFLRLYPDMEGYGYFLIEAPAASEAELTRVLETQLTPYGFDVSSVAGRIAEFLVVQNTYLSTFQTLGGLGLLLGTFGLGTVMLRNVLERRAELALMRAVGFRNSQLSRMILLETLFLLGWGLVAGTVAALLAVLPHLGSRGAEVPVTPGVLMLLAVFLSGLGAAWFAVRAAARTPIVATLRGE